MFVLLVERVVLVACNMLYIPLYEGKYSITVDGRVYSHERRANDGRLVLGKWLKPSIDKDGYKRVTLYSGGRGTQKLYRICRLVASTYLIPVEGKSVVNHINGIKSDDWYGNLEWVTVQENTKHAWSLGLCKPYDRKGDYNRNGIIESNKRRRKSGI